MCKKSGWGIYPPNPLFLGDTSPIPPVSRMSIGYVLGMFWVCCGFMCKKNGDILLYRKLGGG